MNKLFNKIEKLYYVVFVVFLITSLLDIVSIASNPIFSMILKCIRYLCYLYFGFIFIKNIKKVTYVEIIILLLSLVVGYFSGNKFLVITMLVITSVKNYDLKKIFKLSFFTMLLFFTTIVILSQIRIIPDWIFERDDIIRHSLGFIYPTDCFSLFLVIVLLYFAAYDKEYSAWFILFFEILNIILYIYTNGRLSFYLINLTLIIMLVLKITKVRNLVSLIIKTKVVKGILFLLPFIFFSVFMVVVSGYSKELDYADKVDDVLSGRVRLTSEAFENHKVTVFGEKIEWYGWGGYGYNNTLTNNVKYEYNFVDSSYPRILLDYGIVLSIIVFLAYSFILLYYIKNNNVVMVFVFLIVLLWSLIESSIMNIPRNLFILAFSILLDRFYVFKKDKEVKNEKA